MVKSSICMPSFEEVYSEFFSVNICYNGVLQDRSHKKIKKVTSINIIMIIHIGKTEII